MRRAQYTRILVEGERGLLDRLAKQAEKLADVRIVRAPQTGLVMHKALDPVAGRPFYLGELLVTTCTVRMDDSTGYGACLGDDLDKAYALAVVDAAFQANHPQAEHWIPLLLEEEKRIASGHQEELGRVMRTKVDFATADEYGQTNSP